MLLTYAGLGRKPDLLATFKVTKVSRTSHSTVTNAEYSTPHKKTIKCEFRTNSMLAAAGVGIPIASHLVDVGIGIEKTDELGGSTS